MKIAKPTSLPLDQFIEWALYDKNSGYYMKKNPFGKEGDFITAPNITRLFSEIIAIWIITFWKSIGSPKKFNLIELGAGNGEMMKVITETLKNFPECFNACNFLIHEKSDFLINQQKKKINFKKISWIKNLKKKAEFKEQKTNIKKLEKSLNFEISKNQNIIEYSPKTFKYLKAICEIIRKKNGGILIIDYGYLNSKMYETLQAINNHKYSGVLENIGNSDITYNINFSLFQKFISKFNDLNSIITNQKKFLTSMGILQRAEIVSKNLSFSKKTDLFYRIRRLIDKKQMGELFKVMLIKNKKNKFDTGFQND